MLFLEKLWADARMKSQLSPDPLSLLMVLWKKRPMETVVRFADAGSLFTGSGKVANLSLLAL